MIKFDIDSLNEEQKKAMYETEGPVLVTAGAGSGKTRLLTHRIMHLIKEKGVTPYDILAITFTNKAAGEMKERVLAMDPNASEAWISTFHSMCAKILRQNISNLEGYTSTFSIYSEQDKDKLIKDMFDESGEKDETIKKKFGFHISNFKNLGITLKEYAHAINYDNDAKKIVKYISIYENKLKENNALDFDDLLVKTNLLFETCPRVLNKYSSRFKYILVDEFQDTNKIQYNLVKKLSKVHGNIFVVGDEDQCIYTWRGADFENIFNFTKDFKGAKLFKLERNYRSTPSILSAANNVIKNNVSRLEKKLWTNNPDGDMPDVFLANDDHDEARYVARKITELAKSGYSFRDFAILMRLNALSRPFEEAMLQYNIAYDVYGGFKFFERAEIKNIVSYLRLLANPKDNISFLRIINFPKRGIGDGAIKKLHEEARGRSLFETALGYEDFSDKALSKKFEDFAKTYSILLAEYETLPPDEFVSELIKLFKIRSAYNGKAEEDVNKLLNIDSFMESVCEFFRRNPLMGLTDYLENITLMADIDALGQSDRVTIATVHSTKGLEFKVVFVVGLEESVFPMSRAGSNPSDMEEERRLMYVAMTRAKQKLFLTGSSKRFMYGSFQYQMPSRFLEEIGITIKKRIFEAIEPRPLMNTFLPGKTGGEKDIKRVDVSIFAVRQKVFHPKFGKGLIIGISPDSLVGDIEFENFGVKSLMLDIAPLEICEES